MIKSCENFLEDFEYNTCIIIADEYRSGEYNKRVQNKYGKKLAELHVDTKTRIYV